MKLLNILILTLFFTQVTQAQVSYTKNDSLAFEKYVQQYQSRKDVPLNELLASTAKYFVNKPYVASTLDKLAQEELVVNLREFDCTTFVENCIALSTVVRLDDVSFENYCATLQQLRYRNGLIDNYASRLHYVSDWMYENEKNGLFTNITKDLGGVMERKTINFMSTHPQSYSQLRNDNELLAEIRECENRINKRGGYYVLDKSKINDVAPQIYNGDIIAFATDINGLDFSHIAIAYWHSGMLSFIHASTSSNKVVIEKLSLSDYCAKSTKCTGIVVLRLAD